MDERNMDPIASENATLDDKVKKGILPYLKDFSVVLCVVLILFLFFFRIAVVDGASMNDTLIDGDCVLLLNNLIAGEPKYGDVVVISTENYDGGKPIIKRVIATEGQTVDIDYETGTVKVNGVVLDEPYIKNLTVKKGQSPLHLTVAPGCIFVMGDNRQKSLDSRSDIIGQIDAREVIGKAFFLFFPGDEDGHTKREFKRIGAIS